MRHWKALDPWRRRLALAAAGTPVLTFLILLFGRMLFNGTIHPLTPDLLYYFCLPAAGLLLGIADLLLTWTGHGPKKGGWTALLALSLLPSMILLGIEVCAFLLDLFVPGWFPSQR